MRFAEQLREGDSFLDPGEARERLASILSAGESAGGHGGSAELQHVQVRHARVGLSEEGRPIDGYVFGSGPQRVSLIAGAHADEPVGPDTLRRLLIFMASGSDDNLFDHFTFFVIPHVNPDGENRNWPWISKWPDLDAFVTGTRRELPGRDVEFGFPDRRIENEAVSEWLTKHGPFRLHMSLHGMGFSDGAMLLIEKNWSYRTESLQAGFTAAAAAQGLRLHDHNRKGEKGFFQIAPGFTTTPEGQAMRTYFLSHGDAETAALFGDSSMEFVRSLGGDPLCIVTEMPLFLVRGEASTGQANSYVRFRRDYLPVMRQRLSTGQDVTDIVSEFGLDSLPLKSARNLQLTALDLALRTINSGLAK